MVKIILSNEKMITLTRGNKSITRSELDYETNKAMYDFRGFKQTEDVVKEVKDIVAENVVSLKKKRKTRKKKDE
jgi:hypothetical protein